MLKITYIFHLKLKLILLDFFKLYVKEKYFEKCVISLKYNISIRF